MLYLLSLIGAWFGFANPICQIPVFVLLMPASLILLAKRSEGFKQAFKNGWLAGGLAYAACLYWVALPVHGYASVPWIAAAACPLLLGLYLGLFPGLFSLLIFWTKDKYSDLILGILAGLSWTCLEYLRGYLFTGLPWLNLTQAFSPWPISIQGADIFGAFGLSGIAVAWTYWIITLKSKSWPSIALTLTIPVFLIAYGLLKKNLKPSKVPKIEAAIVQGNIQQYKKWSPDYQNATLNTYIALTNQAMQTGSPELIVWPETALPFYVQDHSVLSLKLRRYVKKWKVNLLTGSPGYKFTDSQNFQIYNQAFLLSRKGEIKDSYSKRHLVPFGEYIPFPKILFFLNKLVTGSSDFSPGNSAKPLKNSKLALGVLICYEIIFPELSQENVVQGSNLLINISNDAWFGKTSAPAQHLNQAVLRAVEQNRWLLRATNTGISAIIKPNGQILKKSNLFEKDFILKKEIKLEKNRTFFSKHFDLIRLVYFTTALVLIFSSLFLSRKQSPKKIK